MTTLTPSSRDRLRPAPPGQPHRIRPLRAALLAGAVAVVLAGCGTEQPPDAAPQTPARTPTAEPTPTSAADPSPTPAAAGCGPVEHPPLQQGSHLIGDAQPPGPYSSTPPTSGWHTSGAFDIGIRGADDPLSEPGQVSVLEADAIVVTHHGLDDVDQEALEALIRSDYDGRVAVTPYDALEPGQVALTAWGTLQLCDGLDLDAVRSFIAEHAAEEPGTPGHR